MTDQQRIDELMKPRYKVISKYPGSEDWEDIDAIIKIPDSRYKYADRKGTVCGVELFDSYPNIYERLKWWEERKPEEMPEYIKCERHIRIEKGTILKANWELCYVGTPYECICHRGCYPDYWIDAEYFSPATEAEYNEYIKSKQ
jgi:hypothetical protein